MAARVGGRAATPASPRPHQQGAGASALAHCLLTHPGKKNQSWWVLGILVKMDAHLLSVLFQTLLGEQCWSLAELVQAVVILAHCHSLCSFVFGCDTNSDNVPLSKSPNGTPPTFCPFDAANGNTNVPQTPTAPTEHKTHRRVNRLSLFLLTFETVGVLFNELGRLLHPMVTH